MLVFDNDESCVDVENEYISYCFTEHIPREVILYKIKSLITDIIRQINSQSSDISIQYYYNGRQIDSKIDPFLDIRLLHEKKGTITFSENPKYFAMLLRVVTIIYESVRKGEYITKRSIFYRDPTLFKHQGTVDKLIEDVTHIFEVPRVSLGILSCPKGLIIGPISWEDKNGDVITCNAKPVNIPSVHDDIIGFKTSAIAILVIEKESVLMRIAQCSIANEVILITGRGVPDYSSRAFLKLLDDALDVPVLGLFDGDGFGAFICNIYKYGSKASALENMQLATPRLKWLGVRPSDIVKFPKDSCRDLTEHESRIIISLLRDNFLDTSWKAELSLLLKLGKTCEIEALMAGDGDDLVHTYLPRKFYEKDWI